MDTRREIEDAVEDYAGQIVEEIIGSLEPGTNSRAMTDQACGEVALFRRELREGSTVAEIDRLAVRACARLLAAARIHQREIRRAMERVTIS